jgi:hypothetical protein
MRSSITFILALFSAIGHSQPKDLNFMLGKWEGSGWSITEKGKINTEVIEQVRCRLNCEIYVVDGLGMRYDSVTKKSVQVHEAFGMIIFDKTKNKWILRAFKNGYETQSELNFVSDKKFEWSLVIPNVGTVRYVTDYSSGAWEENGEFSRDGKTWTPTMSMKLKNVDAANR